MSGYNRVIMMGNLTRDPEHKQLPSGQSVCRLSLASNRQFKSRQSDDLVQEVCFIDIDVWGAQAESCNKYLEKGRSVLIEGRIKFDTWQDNEGQKRSKHSIVADRVNFIRTTPVEEATQGPAATRTSNPGKTDTKKKSAKVETEKVVAFEDDLPF